MKNSGVERFSEFYEKWVWKLEEILHQLLEVSKQKTEVAITEQELQALVSKVTTHLKEYYTVKWGAARQDVLVFFLPGLVEPCGECLPSSHGLEALHSVQGVVMTCICHLKGKVPQMTMQSNDKE